MAGIYNVFDAAPRRNEYHSVSGPRLYLELPGFVGGNFMAPPKLLVLLALFLALIYPHIRADVSVDRGGEPDGSVGVNVVDGGSDFSALEIELDQLKSKILTLDSQISERSQEVKKKDVIIAEKEKIIQDSSNTIESLQKDIVALQKKGTSYAEEQVGKAHARADELEKKVGRLKRELELQKKEKVSLEARVNEAEKKIHELNSKLADLQKVNEEQKKVIRKSERALKVAEEEMFKAKLEATSRREELSRVHGAWLPPWLAVHLVHCKSLVEVHWNEHVKPAWEVISRKALEKKAQAEKWAQPHLETIKTKWVPAAKEQWSVMRTSAEPHVQLLTAKTVEVYKEAKRFTKPYIDQAAVAAKPHVDKVQVALKPYTKKVIHAYGKFLESATAYHSQVQAAVQETLKKHEITRPLATKELEWFAASAILALPVILLARVFSAIFGKKGNKRVRNVNSHHARRKAKRGHPDK
ncbi:uncharacterized protein LOC129303373 isoform X2 [Prosopis cineraria]|uniref:uncharacterized protein LOC129303373 isoform X2 n=1 Tax=Prosopis cineraria TaxID=364024 RepID=UPI00240EC97F|nr:uncharacterized protein LOC129303373 isoform X2 [Prosopis cineraria]